MASSVPGGRLAGTPLVAEVGAGSEAGAPTSVMDLTVAFRFFAVPGAFLSGRRLPPSALAAGAAGSCGRARRASPLAVGAGGTGVPDVSLAGGMASCRRGRRLSPLTLEPP